MVLLPRTEKALLNHEKHQASQNRASLHRTVGYCKVAAESRSCKTRKHEGAATGWEDIKETQPLSTIEGPGLDPATKQDVRGKMRNLQEIRRLVSNANSLVFIVKHNYVSC